MSGTGSCRNRDAVVLAVVMSRGRGVAMWQCRVSRLAGVGDKALGEVG